MVFTSSLEQVFKNVRNINRYLRERHSTKVFNKTLHMG